MTISRRSLLRDGAFTVVGAAAVVGERSAQERLEQDTPLPFYGSAVSGVRPDRGRPGTAGTRLSWSGTPSSPHDRRIALTFDDGPHPDWTPRVLKTLNAARVPATFFCVGRNLRDHPHVHDHSDDHELANHTDTHHDLGRLGYERCLAEISACSTQLEVGYGRQATSFRPPYGHLGGAAVLAAAELGLTTVLWSAQAREDQAGAASQSGPDGIVDQIARDVTAGSILLAHDSGSPDRLVTIERLDRIVGRLRDDLGWTFVTVSQLLGTPDEDRPIS